MPDPKKEEQYKKLAARLRLNVYEDNGRWLARPPSTTLVGEGETSGEAIADLVGQLSREPDLLLSLIEPA